jgi:hypothetical protein
MQRNILRRTLESVSSFVVLAPASHAQPAPRTASSYSRQPVRSRQRVRAVEDVEVPPFASLIPDAPTPAALSLQQRPTWWSSCRFSITREADCRTGALIPVLFSNYAVGGAGARHEGLDLSTQVGLVRDFCGRAFRGAHIVFMGGNDPRMPGAPRGRCERRDEPRHRTGGAYRDP